MASNTLVASSVIAGSLMLHSQIGAPEIQSAVPKESVQVGQSYLERGEALSETRAYPAAIAAYSTAIQLKPDFAEAYNDRGFAYYLSGSLLKAIFPDPVCVAVANIGLASDGHPR